MSKLVVYFLPIASALGLPLLALAQPVAGRPVFVVASPWSGPAEAITLVARADGRVLRGAAIPWIVVAMFEGSDFSTRLRHAGAWLTIDASWVSGCPRPDGSRGR